MTSLLMAGTSIEDILLGLDWIPYIYYPLRFWKNTALVKVLMDLGIQVNAITLIYITKLGLYVRSTYIEA